MNQTVGIESLDTQSWPEEFVQYYLRHPCPKAGGGLNNWLFSTSLHCLRGEVDETIAKTILTPIAAASGREKENEIERQVSCAYASVETATRPPRRWPSLDEVGIMNALDADLKLEFDVSLRPAREILNLIFPGNPLINAAFIRESAGITQRLNDFEDLERYQFIVPNPMSAPYWVHADGTKSAKGNQNTAPTRSFQVVEFDEAIPLEKQPALIAWLKWKWAPRFPLAMIVHSRGRSLHAWFNVLNESDETRFNFLYHAVSLGADKQLDVKSQYCRMPQGTRTGKNAFLRSKKQHVIYFDPTALP